MDKPITLTQYNELAIRYEKADLDLKILRNRITDLANKWERQMESRSLQNAPWAIEELRDIIDNPVPI